MKTPRFGVRHVVPALLSLSVCAQAKDLEINPVVVTANRIEQSLSQALTSVSVITRQEIEKSQALTLADLLQGEAGFEFGRNGGPGSTTSFFLRGQNSINLVVLVDGVRSQVDSIGALQVLDVPLPQIERIEVLRGNASALYGDAALGGVISITTRVGKGKPAAYGAITYGSRQALETMVGYGGQQEDLRLDMNLGHKQTNGFSAINVQQQAGANPDRDGYSGDYWSGKLEKSFGADTKLGLRLTGSRSTADTDNAWAASPADVQQFKKRNNTLALNWRQVLNAIWMCPRPTCPTRTLKMVGVWGFTVCSMAPRMLCAGPTFGKRRVTPLSSSGSKKRSIGSRWMKVRPMPCSGRVRAITLA